MQQPLGDLQDAFTKLNINISTTEEEQEYLLPQWKDITSFLDEATQDFDVGQLVHLQSFTLFDAMSAIEVMDPRMDTGMLVEDRTQNKFDISKRIEPEQILGIMDRLVTREMAWISGHSLSQTVYTCIYFHHTQTLNQLPMPTLTSNIKDIVYGVLKSYILATVKCCHYIWNEMTLGNVFEEEDFTTNLFGLSFNDQNPDVVIFNDLDSSIMLLNHLLNTTLSENHTKVVKEILNRMETRKSFLLALVYFSQNEGSHLSQAKNELSKILKLLENVDLSLEQNLTGAFDPNINRKLTSQTPPRPVELLSEKQSFIDFNALVTRLLSICDVIDFPSVTSLMNYFLDFGSTQPYPDAFSRSKLNTIFFHNQRIFGTLPVPRLILTSVEETVHPPMWWLSINQRIPPDIDAQEFLSAHETLKTYLDRISMVFVEFFKTNCHNRSRQRRMLCKIVAEWEILQEEAAGVDEVFHSLQQTDNEEKLVLTPYYFSSWAYNIKLSMIEKILFLGFELDLYGPHEYIMIYWYLQSVLGSRAYLFRRIPDYMDESSESPDLYNYIRTNQLLNHAKKGLSEAVLNILLATKHTGQWNQRALVFDNEETRYMHRFKPFVQLLSPSHPTYDIFLEDFDKMKKIDEEMKINEEMKNPVGNMKKSIEKIMTPIEKMKEIIQYDLGETKRALKSLSEMTPKQTNTEMCSAQFKEELQSLSRTSVANTITLMYIEKSDIKSVDATFKYHPWFPIINNKK